MSDVGRYRKIFSRLWPHPGFKALKPSARLLALYVLSGPQTNGIGLFRFSVATAAEDLGVGVESVRKGLADLSVTFDWRFDADARVIYIPSWWRWNQPINPNVLTGNLKSLSEIPPCGLVDAFAKNMGILPSTFQEAFVEGCRIRLPKCSATQDQDQEHLSGALQNQEQAKKKKNGTDGSDKLLPIAREVLKYTDRGAPIDILVDTFYQLRPGSHDRTEVIRLINIALQESRLS